MVLNINQATSEHIQCFEKISARQASIMKVRGFGFLCFQRTNKFLKRRLIAMEHMLKQNMAKRSYIHAQVVGFHPTTSTPVTYLYCHVQYYHMLFTQSTVTGAYPKVASSWAKI